ncbi:MAG: hypothetical protein OEO20_11120 [Gemmatimonadota bacterium]|nr:hypothetical protein [Gemmatimonadota bacterium]MDH3367750.1 hypothetical protein [Gemmatimonadota bacterium]MDH3478844.1 hypothetical protein [Gemmatimonadota bacterium]MDH3569471.1 hypothetical protein [Gemmatimonadota bacterium]MDH5549709.1 hypothetical protein [Gemmatimonadota bacterium]
MQVTRFSSLAVAASLVVGLAFAMAACDGNPAEPVNIVDSGSWYVSGFHWPHDGTPLETAHFVVYSDAASTQARQQLADIAEDALADLKARFGIAGDAMFRFPAGQQKIHIYAYKTYTPTEWGGRAYWGGLMIYSLDHPERGAWGHTALDMYVPVVTHEIMHVIESLLRASNNPEQVDVWLTEGIAEFVSGGNAAPSISGKARYDELIAQHGRLNPIAMHRYTDYPGLGLVYDYYLPMFQLAVTYLFDAQGHGASLMDLRDLYLDVRDGMSFSAAFADRLGISVAEYEQQFFDLMNDYLE